MLKWIEDHVVRAVLGAALLLWLLYELTALVFAYAGDVRVVAALVTVAPEISGPISALPVRPDEAVAAGQALLTIEPRPFAIAVATASAARDVAQRQHDLAQAAVAEADAAISQAQARLTDAQQELTREQALARSGYAPVEREQDAQRDQIVAQGELLRAQAAAAVARRLVDVRKAELDAAQEVLDSAAYNLSRTQIAAPMAGRLAPFEARPGDNIAARQPVLVLVTDADWRLVANVGERHLKRLRPGQTAWVLLGSDPWRLHRGRVRSVAPAVLSAPVTATEAVVPIVPPETDWIRLPQHFPVEITLPDLPPDVRLFHGATARVVIWF
ncbi:HlyD family efflux transporter periplasmic adaptor subunit [Roseomonas sp. HJA6]|uniref:HlyD family efflux transporter periplasmic adaptor subunit n=1 Tax=Roseomonas alba TaxID=2846776 RepID=A0ABS7AA64_9PROT|nr:HlyD family efflux transporter periplasmic adaptor subunit [Neoroseomonas alba]MBW6399189.1 HlyD family efflux transporter periplasmic adaptor subunit [Neoroseomonas alba]